MHSDNLTDAGPVPARVFRPDVPPPDPLTVGQGDPEAIDPVRLESAMLNVAPGMFASHGWAYMAWLARATAAEYPKVPQHVLDAAGLHDGWEPVVHLGVRPIWLPAAFLLGAACALVIVGAFR